MLNQKYGELMKQELGLEQPDEAMEMTTLRDLDLWQVNAAVFDNEPSNILL